MAPRTPLLIAVAGLAALTLGITSGFLFGKLSEEDRPHETQGDALEKPDRARAPATPPSSPVAPAVDTENALYLEDLEEIPDPPRRRRVRLPVPVAPPSEDSAVPDARPLPLDTRTGAADLLIDETLAPAPSSDQDAQYPSWKEDDGLGTKSRSDESSREVEQATAAEVTDESADDQPTSEPQNEATPEGPERSDERPLLREGP